LKNAVARTKTVEARDIPLLQCIIAKEGEEWVTLASLLWTSNAKIEAESHIWIGMSTIGTIGSQCHGAAKNQCSSHYSAAAVDIQY
jgi:hypothetical protein